MFRAEHRLLTYAVSFFLAGLAIGLLAVGQPDFAAMSAEPQPRVITADEYIEARCTACHSRVLALILLNRKVEVEGLTSLEPFLIRHHMPDAEARNSLIQFFDRDNE